MKSCSLFLLFGLLSIPSAFAADATSAVVACAEKINADNNITGSPVGACVNVKNASDTNVVIRCVERVSADNGIAGDPGQICADVVLP